MLTTVERARKMLRADPADDEMLALLIPAASAAIETNLKRSFGRAEHTEKVETPQRGYVLLRNYPIESVSSINGKTDLEAYEIDTKRGMIRKDGWERSRKPITIEYTAGYVLPKDATEEAPATLPADLEYGCILMLQAMQREPGVTSERVGDLAVTYAQESGMPAAVRALVGPYRNINL